MRPEKFRSTRPLGPVMGGVVDALSGLEELLRHRGEEEGAIGRVLEEAREGAQRRFDATTRDAQRARDEALTRASSAHDAATLDVTQRLDAQIAAVQATLDAELKAQGEKHADRKAKIDKEADEERWVCESIAESDERQANRKLTAIRARATELRATIDRLAQTTARIASELGANGAAFVGAGEAPADQTPGAEPADIEAALRRGTESLRAIEGLLGQWTGLTAPKVARGAGFGTLAAAIIVVLGAGGFVAGHFGVGGNAGVIGAIAGAVVGAIVLVPLRAMLGKGAHRRIDAIGTQIREHFVRARADVEGVEQGATHAHAREMERTRRAASDETAKVERRRREKISAIDERRATREAEIRAAHETDLAGLRSERHARTRDADEALERATREANEAFERETSGAPTQRDRALASATEEVRERRERLEHTWRQRAGSLASQIERIEESSQQIAPPWDDPAWAAWSPPTGRPACVPIASIPIDVAALAGGLSTDPALAWHAPAHLSLPLALEFPRVGSLFIEADSAGRPAALELARDAMLRLLTAMPPGKVRFTIMDPVGLGQNFAAFMHLADQEERLISRRIWTDPRHIEQRLLDLTEHMESVIQKYLRNEFASIEEYNERAGQIAEPYRVLVIADFPTDISDVAAKRLASIADSGARCGVHMIIVADPSKPAPGGVAFDDLRAASLVVESKGSELRARHPELAHHPLAPPSSPPAEQMTNLLRTVGEHAGDASRVQLPFEAVTPGPEARWTRSSADELRIPLGRKGATQIQELTLGRGTLQHALIAGKTGSGKSTLLHVLITSAALWYSPDELELYLVDFKKGVEFRTYAASRLPHAKVVAIETDREFGLAVLRRLDEELTLRGDQFRALGVQGLPDYREKLGGAGKPMARVLLVIDEFQELFVEDDNVAQEAALLLDRIVRQGRAFGMHVLLGSQTLGGAYSLARTTMGQMNVRIALQCDEMDSYLILSEENSAARLLERPGEAIYNDAGGKVEGNSPFQIVWLPAARRDAALHEVERLAEARGAAPGERIVFEGNVPADPADNRELTPATEAPAKGEPVRLYLGEPTAIAPPTSADLRRQSGANVLIVGQRPDAARSLLVIAGLSFALQHAAAPGARIVFLDGAPGDSLDWEDGLLAPNGRMPVDVRAGHVGDAEALLVEVVAEMDRRRQVGAGGEPPILVLIYALQRFRDLRKSDDFGFSSGDEGEAMDKLFARLLEEGPEVGVHVVFWCDTVTNLERTLERRTLRAIDQRVLLQMSAMDSTAIMDAPTASNLGPNRAILWSDDLGKAMRFRPYASPDPQWLGRLFARASTP